MNNVKTILVIYTDVFLKDKKSIGSKKVYSFNSASDVSVGDMIETREYDTNLQVVKVLPQAFKYYNQATGDLSDTYTSTLQREIRTLEISDEKENIIYGTIINKKDGSN
jgi:hypothetical protein